MSLSAAFYRDFEDKFRGSRKEIMQRLEVYLPLLDAVYCEFPETARAIDFGCGRGEWLQLLKQRGWSAYGIDINPDMVKAAEEIGLEVKIADALSHLQSLPSSSIRLITGFHIAEHLPFEILISFLAESQRVLEEGGLLILETPNPENLTVGTWSFYMDPTHIKPLPPLLLQFLAEKSGFSDVNVIRLNGDNAVSMDSASITEAIRSLLFANMDYAILAQKAALDLRGQGIVSSFVSKRPHGVSSNIDAISRFESRFNDCEQAITLCNQQISAIYASKSWRLTAPIRWMSRCIKRVLRLN